MGFDSENLAAFLEPNGGAPHWLDLGEGNAEVIFPGRCLRLTERTGAELLEWER